MILETNAIESYISGNTDVLYNKWYYSLHPFSLPEQTPELCHVMMEKMLPDIGSVKF